MVPTFRLLAMRIESICGTEITSTRGKQAEGMEKVSNSERVVLAEVCMAGNTLCLASRPVGRGAIFKTFFCGLLQITVLFLHLHFVFLC